MGTAESSSSKRRMVSSAQMPGEWRALQCNCIGTGPAITNAGAKKSPVTLGLVKMFPCRLRAPLPWRGCCWDPWGRCLAMLLLLLVGSALRCQADNSPTPIFPSTSQHPFLVSFTFSFLLGAPPWRQPRQRCYKQDMGSLEICSKQERLKVFNSIPAVNKDKGGSAVWSRESVSDGFALPCHLLKQETNIFLAFAKERIP